MTSPTTAAPPAGGASIVVPYVAFAILSTIVNIAAQDLTMRFVAANVALSIGAGTVSGFAVKYWLDRRFIFNSRYTGVASEARKIGFYGLFSVFTTLTFWAVEIAFWMVWQTDFARYTGAVIGLGIGYVAKYALDKHITFRAP